MSDLVGAYKTILTPCDLGFYKEKGSKFMGYAFPVQHENEVKTHVDELWKMHHQARHVCYAFKLNAQAPFQERANDDGEPSNSAGKPILGQIYSFDLTNILVAVVRYYGGTKLGVGGLITAYKAAAQHCLEQAEIIEKNVEKLYEVQFAYDQMNYIMQLDKQEGISIDTMVQEITCTFTIGAWLSKVEFLESYLSQNHKIAFKQL